MPASYLGVPTPKMARARYRVMVQLQRSIDDLLEIQAEYNRLRAEGLIEPIAFMEPVEAES